MIPVSADDVVTRARDSWFHSLSMQLYSQPHVNAVPALQNAALDQEDDNNQLIPEPGEIKLTFKTWTTLQKEMQPLEQPRDRDST